MSMCENFCPGLLIKMASVNGQTALVIRRDNGQVFSILTMDFEQGQIATIRIIANPEKLSRI